MNRSEELRIAAHEIDVFYDHLERVHEAAHRTIEALKSVKNSDVEGELVGWIDSPLNATKTVLDTLDNISDKIYNDILWFRNDTRLWV